MVKAARREYIPTRGGNDTVSDAGETITYATEYRMTLPGKMYSAADPLGPLDNRDRLPRGTEAP